MRSILFGLVLVLGASACGASGDKCDKACRNYFTLHYWDEADKEIAKAPPDQRDALRRKKVEQLDPRMNQELGMCVSQCREAAGNDEAKCMIEAKTAKDVEACVPPGGAE
ncbi:MAG TPA: hypothetical protein VL463_17900 [Kofleriaceae bacterium]|nr:hypothetical protein [Kofleriaceae bacterium]